MSEYLDMVRKAQEARVELNKSQLKKIKRMYSDIAKDLENQLKTVKKDSLTERWLKDYQKQFKKSIQELNTVLAKDIKDNMGKAANMPANMQIGFFNSIDKKYSLDSSAHFSNMFSRIPNEVIGELISGKFYQDGKGLSPRIWGNAQRANADIDYMIQKGIAAKKSVYDLASDLATHINPEAKKDWDFKKLYPSVGNRQIDYNAARLAVTSISHAYQLSMQRSCKSNPFVEKIEWHTSNSHRSPCALCQSREGKKYDPDELPLDHPWGVCYFTPVIEKSLDDVASELKKWMDGGKNEKLDQVFKDKYGNIDFKKDEVKPQPKVEKPKEQPIKPKQKINVSEELKNMGETFKEMGAERHWKNILKIIEDSPEFIQKWYIKYQNGLQFDSVISKQTAHYSPSTRGITLNLANDSKNTASDKRGKYSTFFHEFGHLLDFKNPLSIDKEGNITKDIFKEELRRKPSEDPRFIKAIKEDYQNMLNSPLLKDKPDPFVRGKLKDLLRAEGDLSSGVQDIYSGLTKNDVRAGWGHDTDYWGKKGNLTNEAFAHMSSDYTNPERLAIMKKWFPESCKTFETIIKEIVES